MDGWTERLTCGFFFIDTCNLYKIFPNPVNRQRILTGRLTMLVFESRSSHPSATASLLIVSWRTPFPYIQLHNHMSATADTKIFDDGIYSDILKIKSNYIIKTITNMHENWIGRLLFFISTYHTSLAIFALFIRMFNFDVMPAICHCYILWYLKHPKIWRCSLFCMAFQNNQPFW